MSVRVAIVEDDAGTREAISAGLRAAGLELVAAWDGAAAARAGFAAAAPDVVVVDLGLGLGEESGIELIAGLAPTSSARFLVYTVFEDPPRVVQAIEAGACGYVLKGAALDELVRGIDAAFQGLAPISPAVARHLLDRLRAPRTSQPDQLSPRERDVLELLVRGHTYESVAIALGLQLGTVQTHVKNLYRKLQVSSKAEATFVALRQGIVSRDG